MSRDEFIKLLIKQLKLCDANITFLGRSFFIEGEELDDDVMDLELSMAGIALNDIVVRLQKYIGED